MTSHQDASYSESSMSEEEEIRQINRRIWKRRVIYLVAAVALFFVLPLVLTVIAYAMGVASWSDIYGPLIFWNELSSRGFLVGFVVTIIFIALMMYFIAGAFETGEGAW
ncbi:MAG: hypothetical protein ACTSVD_04330 [Candidatus Thorarchaeota archaeon]